MTKPFPLALVAAASLAHAQAPQIANADFLGITLRTPAPDVLGLLRRQYPKLQPETTDYTIASARSTLKFHDGYKAMLETHLRPEERGAFAIAMNSFQANALPDGSLAGLYRNLTFNPNQQTLQPLVDGLVAKYGEPTFIDRGNGQTLVILLWSDKMPPHLRRKDAAPNGNIGGTPYAACSAELDKYANVGYEPRALFNDLWPTNSVAYLDAQKAKDCGTVLRADLTPAAGNPAYATGMTLTLANLGDVADRVHAQAAAFMAQAQAATQQKQRSDAKNVPKL